MLPDQVLRLCYRPLTALNPNPTHLVIPVYYPYSMHLFSLHLGSDTKDKVPRDSQQVHITLKKCTT
jgi:hypothetical protein